MCTVDVSQARDRMHPGDIDNTLLSLKVTVWEIF